MVHLEKSAEETAVKRCRTGDKEAFRLLAEAYEKQLFGIAYLMTHDRDLAADMVQEALLKMWQHLPSLRRDDGLKPWLIRILVNEIKQQARKKRLPEVSFEETLECPGNSSETIDLLESKDLHQDVRRAVRELPHDQRETVILRYFGGLSLAEISVVLGCRQGTVKSRLSRALDRLEKELKETGIVEVMK
jgi:RNA polymerase sigma-70 factor, ECF subfamily